MLRQFELETRGILTYARLRFALKFKNRKIRGISRGRSTDRKKVQITRIKPDQPSPAGDCACFDQPDLTLPVVRDLGMDRNYAEVTLLACLVCGQFWLRYFYELEAFTASGRWYLGAITPEQAEQLTAERAKLTLEGLDWYFFGGSYFYGQSGRSSGPLSVP